MSTLHLKAAINGGRSRAQHPATPITPDQLAHDARQVLEVGATVVHLHVRDEKGEQSIAAGHLDGVMQAIRSSSPRAIIGTTTGLWTVKDGHPERLEHVRSWFNLPDFASVAYREDGAEETARELVGRGIALESAVWSMADVPALLASRVLEHNIRVLIEPEDEQPDAAVDACREMAAALRAGGVRAPLLYHGVGETVWPVLRAAALDGAQLRIGLEDGEHLPTGEVAADNKALVVAALKFAQRVREGSSATA